MAMAPTHAKMVAGATNTPEREGGNEGRKEGGREEII